MPTAIVSIYTREGFVIAADGFGGGSDGLSAQKIFSLGDGPSSCASYAISGWAGVTDEETNVHISFDAECWNTARSVDMVEFADLNSYGETFARVVGENIQRKIQEALDVGSITAAGYSREIADRDRFCTLRFNGYFRGAAAMAAWAIAFRGKESSVQQYYSWPDVVGNEKNFHGSDPIYKLLAEETDSGFFEKYKTQGFTKLHRRRGVNLPEAIEAAYAYIDACCQPEAEAIDRACEFIKGKIHIATITPDKGFEWVPGHEPVVR